VVKLCRSNVNRSFLTYSACWQALDDMGLNDLRHARAEKANRLGFENIGKKNGIMRMHRRNKKKSRANHASVLPEVGHPVEGSAERSPTRPVSKAEPFTGNGWRNPSVLLPDLRHPSKVEGRTDFMTSAALELTHEATEAKHSVARAAAGAWTLIASRPAKKHESAFLQAETWKFVRAPKSRFFDVGFGEHLPSSFIIST